MYSTGVKIKTDGGMYQNKEIERFPTTEVSSKRVPDLKVKNMNEIFPAEITVRVAGIEEKDIGGGAKETFYTLEIRQMGIKEKNPDEMTPEEIMAKIEEEQ